MQTIKLTVYSVPVIVVELSTDLSDMNMDATDEDILKNDPELANLFTDDEDEEESKATTFNFGRSKTDSTRRSQSAKLG